MGTWTPTSSSGSSSQSAVGCVLSAAAMDIRTAAQHPFLWNVIYDNSSDYNVLSSLPSGIGFTNPADGSSGTLTFTASGVWSFDLQVTLDADATATVYLSNGNAGNLGAQVGPVVVPTGGSNVPLSVSETLLIPSGATTRPAIQTLNAATGNPYNVTPYLVIVRLA